MTTKPYCFLCGRSAAKWGPLIARDGDHAHEDCWQRYNEKIAAIVAESPPLGPETLAGLYDLLGVEPPAR